MTINNAITDYEEIAVMTILDKIADKLWHNGGGDIKIPLKSGEAVIHVPSTAQENIICTCKTIEPGMICLIHGEKSEEVSS